MVISDRNIKNAFKLGILILNKMSSEKLVSLGIYQINETIRLGCIESVHDQY